MSADLNQHLMEAEALGLGQPGQGRIGAFRPNHELL